MSIRALIFHILFLFFSLPAFAAGNWCAPAAVPSVDVKTDTDRIQWVYNKSEKSLNQKDIDTISPYGNNVITDVGGLMQGGIKMSETMLFGSLTNPNTRETCMFYSKVEVTFHIYPTIYIASEFRPGSCMHNAIKQHEMKHITADRLIVNKYAQATGNAIRQEIQRQHIYGPVPNANLNAVKSQMQTRMTQILKVYSDAMDTERRTVQQGIDNLQEYERVNHLCDSRVR